MLSIGQKLIALAVILVLDVAIFVFSPLFGIIALFASAPLALALLWQ